jgi:hypothetical protein
LVQIWQISLNRKILCLKEVLVYLAYLFEIIYHSDTFLSISTNLSSQKLKNKVWIISLGCLILECIVDLALDPFAALWFVSLYHWVISSNLNSTRLTQGRQDPSMCRGSGRVRPHHKILRSSHHSISLIFARKAGINRRHNDRYHRSRGMYENYHHVWIGSKGWYGLCLTLRRTCDLSVRSTASTAIIGSFSILRLNLYYLFNL